MNRRPPRARVATAVVALLTALAGSMPATGRADATPARRPPTGAETLVTNTGAAVTAPFPGVDRHGWSGSTGTADTPAGDAPAGDLPTDDLPTGDLPVGDTPVDQPGTMSIIGTDDTVRVADVGAYPARVTGLITRGGFPHCTGTLVSPDVVLTAGHCLHDTTGGRGWWPGLAFHTRLFSDGHRACAARADGLMAFRGWVERGDERHDVGLMRLTCAIGESDGWLGVAPAPRNLTGVDVMVQGFPGERLAQLWMSTGPILHDDRHLVFYDNDTLEGMSGAALQRHQPRRGRACSGQCVVGVHAYGRHDGDGRHARHNHGPRLTPGAVAALRAALSPETSTEISRGLGPARSA